MDVADKEEVFLADSRGWQEEAKAVINDVKEHVNSIEIALIPESSNSNIYLEVITLEEKKITVELSSMGFCIMGDEEEEVTYYETPYALLESVSPSYRTSFGSSLSAKLSQQSQ